MIHRTLRKGEELEDWQAVCDGPWTPPDRTAMHHGSRFRILAAILLLGFSPAPVSAADGLGGAPVAKDWEIGTTPSGTNVVFFCRAMACSLNSVVRVRFDDRGAPDRAAMVARWGTTDIVCGQHGPFDYCQAHRLFDGRSVTSVKSETTGETFDATVIGGYVLNRRMDADGYPVLITIESSSDDARLAEANFIMVRDLLIQNHASWPP